MSIFKANKKWATMAMERASVADSLQAEQQVIDTNRSLLANIRQERLAASQIRFAQSDVNTLSSTAGALGNIQSSFAEPIEYMYRTGKRREEIQRNYTLAQEYLSKYEKQAKKAATTGAIVGSLTGGMGALVVGGVTGAGSDFYRGAMNQQMAGLKGATEGAAAGSAAGPWGAVIGGAIGAAAGSLSSVGNQTGKNRTWANATNVVNWSRTQWTGETYKPVQAANWYIDLSGINLKSLGVLGGGGVEEEGGAIDKTETNIGFAQNTYKPIYNLDTMSYDYSSWGIF